MHIAIIGKQGSGKSTLFSALSGKGPGTSRAEVAAIDVPDERVDYLANIFRPKKTTYVRIDVRDTAGIDQGDLKDEKASAKLLQQLRESDAFLLVLSAFEEAGPDEAVETFRMFETEFILADMIQIENRLQRMEKQTREKDNPAQQQEKAMLQACLSHLDTGSSLSAFEPLVTDDKSVKGFRFLSQKPVMAVLNCREEDIARSEEMEAALRTGLSGQVPVVATSARLEEELSLLPADEHLALMADFGIKESLRGKIIRLARDTLGLISFLTVGEDECRAWSIRKGMTAQEAAGAIHTDLSHKFIRSETVSYDDFVQHQGFPGCKKAGVWRLEGKQYVVQDGDILSIRAGN
jgi:ribosome-binding ATPase